MGAPRVSVVVPNYNHGPYLAERMESVLGQTLEDIEVIVIDDASSDDSLAVLRRYQKDPRVRVVVNETNSGNPFVQWNRGAAMARGELLWIAEADDSASPELLEVLVARHDAHGVGIAYCQSEIIDAGGEVVGLNTAWTDDLDGDRWHGDHTSSGREECRRFMVRRNVIPNASAAVFRRDLFHEIGGAPETLRYAGDWMTWTRMLLRCDLAFAADPLNRFRRHEATVTRRSVLDGRWAEEGYLVLREVLEAVEPDDDAVERARDALMRKWASSATSPRSRMTPADHRRVHAAARRCDPHLLRRAVRTFRPASHVRGLLFVLRIARLGR